MARTVPLGENFGDFYIVLREDVTTRELENVLKRMEVVDRKTGVVRDNRLGAVAYAIGVVIEEWHVGSEKPPSSNAWRDLPARVGTRVSSIIGDYLMELQGIDDTDSDDPKRLSAGTEGNLPSGSED